MNHRDQFAMFDNQPDCVYLDGASSLPTLKTVIAKLNEYYSEYPVNSHRGMYAMSERATIEVEKTRAMVADWLGTKSDQVIFTSGTTDGMNKVAIGIIKHATKYPEKLRSKKRLNVAVSVIDHHASYVTWKSLAEDYDFDCQVMSVDENGIIDLDRLSRKTDVFSLQAVSNVTGIIQPIAELVTKLRKINPDMLIILDAAQHLPHLSLDLSKLDIDAVVFSGHKLGGPKGVGCLWMSTRLLDRCEPFVYGGSMVAMATTTPIIYQDGPQRFEAGTLPIADIIALQEAITYQQNLDHKALAAHVQDLRTYLAESLVKQYGAKVKFVGPPSLKNLPTIGICSFTIGNIHPHDVAQILAENNVCVRAGHHCAQPLHEFYGIDASVRVSLYCYSTKQDIDALLVALQKAHKLFS